jgi:hypothetical protein
VRADINEKELNFQPVTTEPRIQDPNFEKKGAYLASISMAKATSGPIEAPSKRAAAINRATRFCCLPRNKIHPKKREKCKNQKHGLINNN